MNLLKFLTTILFLFGSLYLTNRFNSISSYIISGVIILIALSFIVNKEGIKLKFNTSTFLIVYLFFLSCLLSALFNSDAGLAIDSIVMVLLYIAACIILPSINVDGLNKMFYSAVMFSHVPILFIPFILNGIPGMSYKGIFYNPNAFGSTVATVFTFAVALFFYKIECYISGKKEKRLFLTSIFLLILLFLIVISGSRTSLLSVVAVSVIGVLFLITHLIKQKKVTAVIKKGTVLTISSGIILFFIFKFTSFYQYLQLNILNKFQRKAADVLDGRGDVWTQTISEAGMFGNGSRYFSESTSTSAHNTFINILGEYGWFALLFFALLILVFLRSSIKYAFSSDDRFKYLPLMLVTSFVLLSMGENMMYKLSMLAMFLSAGISVHYTSKQARQLKLDKKYDFLRSTKTMKKDHIVHH